MSEEFKVEIVNPEKSFLVKDDVSEVLVPAFEGEMGILMVNISIMSQNVSYYWFGRTQYIPRFGGVLQELGILLEGCLTVKN